jgi:hypothetical protein
MMRRLVILGIGVVAAAALVAPTATARGGDGIVRTGSCTGASTWELKAKFDDGRIEVEFEVDQNRNGRRWDVRLHRDGRLVFHRVRTTRPPSGSFEVRRLLANTRGTDRIVGRARARATGEICRGALTI